MADEHDENQNNFLARIGQIKEPPKSKPAPVAEEKE